MVWYAKIRLCYIVGKRNVIKPTNKKLNKDDIVVIHDGIHPMVDAEIISSCIDTCMEKGNGVSAFPVYEQIFETDDDETTDKYIPREKLRIVQTPQAYRYGNILDVYNYGFANNIGIHGSSYANTLMADVGEELYFQKVQLRILR